MPAGTTVTPRSCSAPPPGSRTSPSGAGSPVRWRWSSSPPRRAGPADDESVEDGVLDGSIAPWPVARIYGLHGWPLDPAGTTGIDPRADARRERQVRDRGLRRGMPCGVAALRSRSDRGRRRDRHGAARDRVAKRRSARRGGGQRDEDLRGFHVQRDPSERQSRRHRPQPLQRGAGPARTPDRRGRGGGRDRGMDARPRPPPTIAATRSR